MAPFKILVLVCAVVDLAGCSGRRDALVDAGGPADTVDAAGHVDAIRPVDAMALGDGGYVCESPPAFPVTVTGTSPAGSLDVFHYAVTTFVTGFCPNSYLIDVTPGQVSPTCQLEPWLQLAIFAPFTRTGTHRAYASLPNQNQFTDKVTFEATELDQPDATTPHVIGHFVSHDPAWSFDIAIDLTSQSSQTCI